MSERTVPKELLYKTAHTIFPDRQFVSLLKWELKLLLIFIYSKISPVEWMKRLSRKKGEEIRVNIGSGPFRHEKWVNLDCRLTFRKDTLVCDLRRKWPLRSNSVRFIFSEHVFEHFGYPDEIGHILTECRRVLLPGGVLRIIVPNLERYLHAYIENDIAFLTQAGGDAGSKVAVINQVMRENGFHKYCYDYEAMKKLLQETGFSDVQRSSCQASQYEDLNLDYDEPTRKLVSLYVEAKK
jgi:predicted SAM-dependent methyltransferase